MDTLKGNFTRKRLKQSFVMKNLNLPQDSQLILYNLSNTLQVIMETLPQMHLF